MKTKILSILSAVIALSLMLTALSGCSFVYKTIDTEIIPDEKVPQKPGIEMKTLCELFDKNIDCMNIFENGTLEYDTENAISEGVYAVTNKAYPDLAALSAYVHGIYIDAEAERILTSCPWEGKQLYSDIDGKLCIDTANTRPRGYFVDWTQYTVKIISQDSESCTFAVTGLLTEPGDNLISKDYTVTGRIKLEDGEWKLEKMML